MIFVGPYRVAASFDVVLADGLSSTELAARIDALRQTLARNDNIASVTITPTVSVSPPA